MNPDALQNAPIVVLVAVVGFLLLAFILLYPIYRFISREEEASREWTRDRLARSSRERRHGGNGAPEDETNLPEDVPKKRRDR